MNNEVNEALQELKVEGFFEDELYIEELEVDHRLKCDCEIPYSIFYDPREEEVTFVCRGEVCTSFWMSKVDAEEFIEKVLLK